MSKIVVATDQPFWRLENGAHHRIYSLIKFLLSRQHEITLFYMVELLDRDREILANLDLQVVEYDPAGGIIPRVAQTIVDAGRKLTRRMDSPIEVAKEVESAKEKVSATLQDYRWPHAVEQFRKLVENVRPQFVLIEYVTWAYLLDGVHSSEVKTMIDTHDALHVRNQQFNDNGQEHWLEISHDEEAKELSRFDAVLAIQVHESNLFRQMAPHSEHLVVGHVPEIVFDRQHAHGSSSRSNGCVNLGFIGSNNHANVDGIQWFLENCWPQILTEAESPCRLIIGGPIREGLDSVVQRLQPSELSMIEFIGPVQCIADFYARIDIAINPVRYGSGLKIKSIESIVFSKPLVANPHSMTGIPDEARGAAVVCESATDFARACVVQIDDSEFREQMREKAFSAGVHFLPKAVYSELASWMDKQSEKPA